MRARPNGKAAIVQRIPQSAEVGLEKCAHRWCRASWRGRFGYIPAEAMVLGPPPSGLPGDAMPPRLAMRRRPRPRRRRGDGRDSTWVEIWASAQALGSAGVRSGAAASTHGRRPALYEASFPFSSRR
jgi:hypothetical protein